jgi:hypothetical protein
MSQLKIPSDEHLANLWQYANLVVPRGWRVKVRRHPSGGVQAIVTQAPVDLLQDLQSHGLPLNDCMWYPGTMHSYMQFLSPENRDVIKELWLAINDGNPPLGAQGHYYVALEIGSKSDPFIHVLLDVLDNAKEVAAKEHVMSHLKKVGKVKSLHPKVQAYADHAKAMGALMAAQKAHEADAERKKKLFPPSALKQIELAKGNRSWA